EGGEQAILQWPNESLHRESNVATKRRLQIIEVAEAGPSRTRHNSEMHLVNLRGRSSMQTAETERNILGSSEEVRA
ncbi:hypothetical protein, partial [Phenylobacterium sp.]|uniref:hypothetical protein n=1 Tax=Phenylobacterium sp. TaxID=1871053 RepID=UPI00286D7CB8